MSKLLRRPVVINEIASTQVLEDTSQVMQINDQDVANPSDRKGPICLLSFPCRNPVRNPTAMNVTNKQFLRFEFQLGTFGLAIIADDRLLFQLSLAKYFRSIHGCANEELQIRARFVIYRKRYEDRHGIAVGYVANAENLEMPRNTSDLDVVAALDYWGRIDSATDRENKKSTRARMPQERSERGVGAIAPIGKQAPHIASPRSCPEP